MQEVAETTEAIDTSTTGKVPGSVETIGEKVDGDAQEIDKLCDRIAIDLQHALADFPEGCPGPDVVPRIESAAEGVRAIMRWVDMLRAAVRNEQEEPAVGMTVRIERHEYLLVDQEDGGVYEVQVAENGSSWLESLGELTPKRARELFASVKAEAEGAS